MTATKSEATVPVPLSQLKEIHQIWLEFISILTVTDRGEFDSLMNLLEPIEKRMSGVVVEEWENLIHKAEEAKDRDEVTTQEITVAVPLEQLKAVHQIWLEFSSILSITDRNEFDSLMNLLEPLNDRLVNIVFEEWESLINKAEKKAEGAK